MLGDAQCQEPALMFGGAVARVRAPPIARMHRIQPQHDAVAVNLGDDRGGGDRGRDGVAADHRSGRTKNSRRALVAVDQGVRGGDGEVFDDSYNFV